MKTNQIFLFLVSFFLLAQSAFALSTDITIGGQTMTIPAPSDSFMEMPVLMAEQTKANLPPSNRYLCGFLDTNDLSGNTTSTLQTLIQLEGMNVTPDMFGMLMAQTKAAIGSTPFEEIISDYSEENQNFDLGQPHMLGTLFESADRFAYAMDIVVSDNLGNSTHIVIGSCMMTVKGHMILATLTYPYSDGATLKILKPQMETWVQAIVDANK